MSLSPEHAAEIEPSGLQVRSPADGRVVGTVACLYSDQVHQRVVALRASQSAWEAAGVHERVRWVRRYRDWLFDNEDRLTLLLQSETGKPWGQTKLEVGYIAMLINYYTDNAPRFLKDKRLKERSLLTATKQQTLRHRPYPVVGVISPWNFPLAISLIDAIPALLAGAAVIVKPSEFTPLAVHAAVDGWSKIGAPPVFASATGAADTGAAVVDNVDYIQFIGSTLTGRAIAVQAAAQLKPCGLELGGKDAMIVLADADLERAANAAVWGAMANSGQMCTSVERVYVEASAYEDFLNRVATKVEALRVGDDDQSYRCDLGPLATPAQLAIVRHHVEDALAKGATVRATAPTPTNGNHHPPMVLAEVDHSMLCMTEETFGPLLPVMRVRDAEEAVELANESIYGLSASVFGTDIERAQEVARRIEAGAVNVNDMFANLFTLPLPQAGWRQSGLGARIGGAHGTLKYCRPQALVVSRFNPSAEPTWFPYTRRRSATVSRLLRLANGRDLRRRLGMLGKS